MQDWSREGNVVDAKQPAVWLQNALVNVVLLTGVLGNNLRMMFEDTKGKPKWYEGVIVSYNGMTKKYGIYFPCDKQTVETSLDNKDLEMES